MKKMFALLLMVVAAFSFVACTDDADNGGNYTNGVIMPTITVRTIKADGGSLSVTFETSNTFDLEVEAEEDMISSMELNNKIATSGKAGKQSLKFMISKNSGETERVAEVYITVKDCERVKLVTIKQKTKSEGMDEVVKYMDERLKTEYYWLDEYNEKWNSFDFNVEKSDETGYNNMLLKVLGSMTSNADYANHYVDGGEDAHGRYIYTYVEKTHESEHSSSTRAGGSVTYGYGFDICLIRLTLEEGISAYMVDHVYPNSPVSGKGLIRGDLIMKVNGQSITGSTYAEIASILYYQTQSSIKIEKMDYATREKKEITIARGSYKANPVAYSGVLNLSAEENPSGKKIGYMAYVSFDGEGDDKMVDAISDLAAEGVEEMILDLRSNGGGSVVSAVKLCSMLVSESYVGNVCCELRHNPNNALYKSEPNEIYEFISKNVKGAYNEGDNRDLPNLNMQKVYVIVSDDTASASEMVIMALRGIDVEVELIGLTTNGKNCGMEVSEKKIGDYYYKFAPITFFNYNAKGEYRYCLGIKPQADFDELYEAEKDKAVKQEIYYYPLPMAQWGNVKNDIALREAVARINGGTLFGKEVAEEEAVSTRSGARLQEKVSVKSLQSPLGGVKKSGLYLMEGDHEVLRSAQDE